MHLLRPGASGQDELLACRAACEIPNVHHLVWLIGNTRDERDARSLGLRISARFSPRAANLGPIARLVRPGGAMMPHANRLDASAQVLCWGTPTLDIARALRIPIAAAVLLDSRDIRTTDLHRTPAIAFAIAHFVDPTTCSGLGDAARPARVLNFECDQNFDAVVHLPLRIKMNRIQNRSN